VRRVTEGGAEVREFLDSQHVGVLATLSESGRTRQSVVYYVRDGEQILISTLASRYKAKDVQRCGWASFCAMGHEPPYPSLTVAGPAHIRAEGISAATAAIVRRVTGEEPSEPPSDAALAAVGRVILAITMQRIGPSSYISEPS
jgi:PPOX class probable F420-dependent enzyme